MGEPRLRSEWQQLVRLLEGSGLTLSAFAALHGVGHQSLRRWRAVFRREGELARGAKRSVAPGPPNASPDAVRLVRVISVRDAGRPRESGLTLEVGAVRIAVGCGFDAETLAGVLSVVTALRSK